jgi:beta-glucosidase
MNEAARVNEVLGKAHRTATAAMRTGKGSPQVGTCLQLLAVEPLRADDEGDIGIADWLRGFLVDAHVDDLARGGDDVGDFVGLQYYTRLLADASSSAMVAPPPAGAETTQMGWEVYPQGFGTVLRRIADAGLPVYVTENGIATTDDTQRVRYLASHLAQVKDAMADGVDVRGYLHWSAFDNFEWAHGYRPRFGLIGIDREDGFRRIVRPSAELYGEVARSGSLAPLVD